MLPGFDSRQKVESQVWSLRQDTIECRASIAALQTNEMVDRWVCSELNQQMQQINSLVTQTSSAAADIDSRVSGLEDTSYNGVFVWEFGAHESRLPAPADEQKSFVSPIFYTSRHGYSLCIRFYPAGDGIGCGTAHVSLFVAVVRGRYDSLQ